MQVVQVYPCGCIKPRVLPQEEYAFGYTHVCNWHVEFLRAFDEVKKKVTRANSVWYHETYLPDLNRRYQEHYSNQTYVEKTVYEPKDIKILVPKENQ